MLCAQHWYPWYPNPLVSWPLPLLGFILAIGALPFLAPCPTQFLTQQISSIAKVPASQVLVQYQTVLKTEADDSAVISPL